MLKEKTFKLPKVAESVKQHSIVHCYPHTADLFFHQPVEFLHMLTRYQFAAKMVGKNKKVIDIDCQEGLGTHILSSHCGRAIGIDSKESSIEFARQNFQSPTCEFICGDYFDLSPMIPDAMIYFKNSEMNESELLEFSTIAFEALPEPGLLIVGAKNTALAELDEILKKTFPFVFLFASQGECIRLTDKKEIALSYSLAMACK